MTHNEDLLQFFSRISNGEATDEEITEYNRWCNAFQTEGTPLPNIEEIKAEMLTEIRKQIRHNPKTIRLRLWTKIAAAASVILIVAIGEYYLIHKSQPKQIAQVHFHDLSPGGNKATLTLANGQTIILENVHNGQLANQGNSRVMKADSGLLIYSSLTIHHSPLTAVSYNTLTVPRGDSTG